MHSDQDLYCWLTNSKFSPWYPQNDNWQIQNVWSIIPFKKFDMVRVNIGFHQFVLWILCLSVNVFYFFSIISTALMGTSLIFISFSLAALYNTNRTYLYMGGKSFLLLSHFLFPGHFFASGTLSGTQVQIQGCSRKIPGHVLFHISGDFKSEHHFVKSL